MLPRTVCGVCGVWCVVWCLVCGVWCVVRGVWCAVYVVCGVWCVVFTQRKQLNPSVGRYRKMTIGDTVAAQSGLR